MQHLGDTTKSKAVMEEACNALAWIHFTSGLPSPTSCPFMQATSEGLQRILAKPVKKKKPVSVELLGRIVEDTARSNLLLDICPTKVCLVAFAGFLRFNELVNIRPSDIELQENFMTLCQLCSKTDQFRKGDELVIARTGSATCPVAMLELYMRWTHTSWNDKRFLFRPICKAKLGERLEESGSISYSFT